MDYHLIFTQRALTDLAEIIGHLPGTIVSLLPALAVHCWTTWIYYAGTHESGAQSANGRSCGSWYTARFWLTTKSTNKSSWWRSFTSGMARGSHQSFKTFAGQLFKSANAACTSSFSAGFNTAQGKRGGPP